MCLPRFSAFSTPTSCMTLRCRETTERSCGRQPVISAISIWPCCANTLRMSMRTGSLSTLNSFESKIWCNSFIWALHIDYSCTHMHMSIYIEIDASIAHKQIGNYLAYRSVFREGFSLLGQGRHAPQFEEFDAQVVHQGQHVG